MARFLEREHIKFDSGGAHTVEGVGKFISNYHRDICRNKRDFKAVFAYFFYLQGWAFEREVSSDGARDLAKLTEKHIITDFGGRDLRAASPIL